MQITRAFFIQILPSPCFLHITQELLNLVQAGQRIAAQKAAKQAEQRGEEQQLPAAVGSLGAVASNGGEAVGVLAQNVRKGVKCGKPACFFLLHG